MAGLRDIAIAATGLRFTSEGQLAEIPISDWVTLIRDLQNEKGEAIRECVRTLFSDVIQQQAFPGAGPTWGEVVANAVNSGDMETVRAALAKEPENPLLLLALARFEENEKRANFLRHYAVSRLPKKAEAWAIATKLLIIQGMSDEANDATSEAEQLDPTLPEVLRFGFYARMLAGKQKEAMEKIMRLTATENARPQDWADAVYAVACDGNPTRTLELIQTAAKTCPKSPEVSVASGRAFLLLQMNSKALECFQKAKLLFGNINGDRPDVIGGILISEWLVGKRQEAAKQCAQFLNQKFVGADLTLADDSLDMQRLASKEWPITFDWNPSEEKVLVTIRDAAKKLPP
jgi:tetratricopeptide (TPR) repeat protein